MITFTKGDTTCLRSNFVGRDDEQTKAIGSALAEWAAAMPAGAAEVEQGARITLTACDPGAAGTEAPNRALEALLLAGTRDGLMVEILKGGTPVKVAVCTSDTLVQDPSFAPLLDALVVDPNAEPEAERARRVPEPRPRGVPRVLDQAQLRDRVATLTPEPLVAFDRDGYVVLEDVIEADLVGALLETIDRVMVDAEIPFGSNSFLGVRTRRIFNLLARDPLFARVPLHPAVLPLVEQVLDEQCLLSSLTAIEMQPGQEAQPLHADDGSIALPRPHPTVVCVALWALTDFDHANGATRLVPGSHRARPSSGEG